MNASAIDGESLKEEILKEIKEEIASGVCQELTSIWTELWDETEQNNRKNILANECKKELREFLQGVLKDEKKVRDNYISRIEELLSEMSSLQKNLEIAIPYEDVETLPLHIMAARLNKKAEKYRALKNELNQKLNELLEKEANLCEKLGMSKHQIDKFDISTKAKLKLLENHIAVMEEEKVSRTLTFLERRQAVIKLYEELGIQPLLAFEKKLLSEEGVEDFPLTDENMSKMNSLQEELMKQVENARETVSDLKEKLGLLWNYLGESEEHKKQFFLRHSGCSVSTISALKEELGQCEARKKENISTIVERIRQVLIEQWDLCLVAKEDRDKFRPFVINCFTENLCDLHEIEIKRLKNFYSENKQIFSLIQKHQKLFNKLLELKNGSKNANRYYNRGGQLLQEEKERRLITKELPAVEEELKNLLKIYQEKNGAPFTAYGVPVETVLQDQWNAHFDQKTVEKLTRKKGGASRTPLGKRACTTPHTPLSANKVSRLNTQKTTSAAKTATPKIASTALTTVPQRKRKAEDCGKATATLVLEPTYDDFQNGLQSKLERSVKCKKAAARSTAIKGEVPGILRERNAADMAVRRPGTPLKTSPGKPSTPMWSPSAVRAPKTVPRARKENQMTRSVAVRNRLPFII